LGRFWIKKKYNVNRPDDYYVRVQVKIASTCVEKFELENFPFDEQDLSIHFHEVSGISKWRFAPETRGKESTRALPWINIIKRHFVAPEWKFVSAIAEISETSGQNSKSGKKYSTVIVRLKMLREWKSYKNIFWPMMILTALSLFVFAIDIDNIADRLAYTVTLLLTVVAFGNSVQDQLPDLPILTILDKFVMFSFGFISCVMGGTVLLTFEGYSDAHDEIALLIFVIIWMLIHGYMYYIVHNARTNERKKVDQTSLELNEKEMMDFLISCDFKIIEWEDGSKDKNGVPITNAIHVYRQDHKK